MRNFGEDIQQENRTASSKDKSRPSAIQIPAKKISVREMDIISQTRYKFFRADQKEINSPASAPTLIHQKFPSQEKPNPRIQIFKEMKNEESALHQGVFASLTIRRKTKNLEKKQNVLIKRSTSTHSFTQGN